MSSPEALSRIVTKFGRLRQLASEARRLERLNRTVTDCLPAQLRDHVSLGAIRDGCLVLTAENPSWAAQIRYRAPEILGMLGAFPDFSEIRSIRVRNRLDTAPSTQVPAAPRLSTAAAKAITTQAGTIEDDAVRNALLRLARRGKGSEEVP